MNKAMAASPKIKICGITRAEDALLAEEAGADFLGFIFVKGTPRCITVSRAGEIIRELESAKPVGVFMNQPQSEIKSISEEAGLKMIQLHGNEPPEFCAKVDLPVVKVFSVKAETTPEQLLTEISPYAGVVEYLLFDTYDKNQGGGTGRRFNWNVLEGLSEKLHSPYFVAGGLNPENAADAAEKLNPFALDISSGVEQQPGIKDHDKIRKLFSSLR